MITLIILVLGVFAIVYGIHEIHAVLHAAKQPKALEPSYDNRWYDKNYVDMIHNTIQLEKNELGKATTKCEAPCCAPLPSQKYPDGRFYDPNMLRDVEYTPDRVRNVEGYLFHVPANIPDGADAELYQDNYSSYKGSMFADEIMYAMFSWWNPFGEQKKQIVSAHLPQWVGRPIACALCETTDGIVDGLCRPHYLQYKAPRAEDKQIAKMRDEYLIRNGFLKENERRAIESGRAKTPLQHRCDWCGIKTLLRDGLCIRCRRVSQMSAPPEHYRPWR